jgi:hypothetical protein
MSFDASRDPTDDLALEAEQLRVKYDGLVEDGDWGEHPNHPMEVWQTEVHCKNTRLGYWDWVVTKLKLADDKTDEDSVLADAEEQEIAELQAGDPGNQGA